MLYRRSPSLRMACALAGALLSLPLLAQAATRTVAYAAEPGYAQSGAYLIEWRPANRAQVVLPQGAGAGSVSVVDVHQVITLDTPISQFGVGPAAPCDGLPPDQRYDTQQVAVRTRSGTPNKGQSGVIELGTITTLTGCEAGKVETFGALTDTGLLTLHRSLSARAPMDDLVPGASLSGMSENGSSVADQPPVDTVLFQAGAVQFGRSGQVVPASLNAAGWWVLDLPTSGQRAYTRLTAADKNGIEVWMAADLSAGEFTHVVTVLMVKPVAGTTFGSRVETSRMWQSGIFTLTRQPFFVYLYKDLTGDRVQKDLDTGGISYVPITWNFSGDLVVQERTTGPNLRRRFWQPLVRTGKSMAVFEAEIVYFPDGSDALVIAPRVNYYLDTGKAVKPAQAGTARPGATRATARRALPA